MQMLFRAALLSAGAAAVVAQSNTVPGLDCSVTNAASPTYFGRRGAAHPNGEIGMSYSYTMCNPGTVPIPWNAPMNPSHPMFAFMVVRESNGRFEQITNQATTYVKHAFSAANSASTCGGTCQSSGSGLRVNCTDTYGASTNANRFYLGPASEIDPWTGTWQPFGSYFDRGDPDVGPPLNNDGVRSLTSSSGGFPSDAVKNRVTLREQDLLVPGRLFYCMHIVVNGEDGDLHFDNFGRRQVTATWGGTTWSFATPTAFVQGSVLNEWPGASVTSARNGDDDGHFFVAVKVTPLPGGMHHYEYAVQNLDNHRGGASLRVPVCSSTNVTNVGFRDPDGDALNDWTWSRAGEELVFGASATNSLDWNNIYNFWFDCDQAPVAGSVAIDQARLGPGALSVVVATQIPAGLASVATTGPGCGVPTPALGANGLPTIPNPAFAITIATTPAAALLLFDSLGAANVVLAPGCVQHLDGATLVTHGLFVADGAGQVTVPVPVPNTLALDGVTVHWQAAQVEAGGPVAGAFTLSNGLATLVACR
jgi:hypothetical protein